MSDTQDKKGAIYPFEGKYYFLNNDAPSKVRFSGIDYPTLEHAYQASKTTDLKKRHYIAKLDTPVLARRYGKKLPIRKDCNWDNVKLTIMEVLINRKFKDNPSLKRLLILTGERKLLNVNTNKDAFWGIYKDEGENHLGLILMKIRDNIILSRSKKSSI